MSAFERRGCRVFPTTANFFLTQFPPTVSSDEIYASLRDQYKIVLRKRSDLGQLKNVLRVTVGNPKENDFLLSSLSSLL